MNKILGVFQILMFPGASATTTGWSKKLTITFKLITVLVIGSKFLLETFRDDYPYREKQSDVFWPKNVRLFWATLFNITLILPCL